IFLSCALLMIRCVRAIKLWARELQTGIAFFRTFQLMAHVFRWFSENIHMFADLQTRSGSTKPGRYMQMQFSL
ncbi:hypothetical protein BDQ17DRAFT_1370986, partial [Cyathus striatus]